MMDAKPVIKSLTTVNEIAAKWCHKAETNLRTPMQYFMVEALNEVIDLCAQEGKSCGGSDGSTIEHHIQKLKSGNKP